MKCYEMHEDTAITSTIDGSHPIAEAVTVYQGYAVCHEHLQGMQESQRIKDELATKTDAHAVDRFLHLGDS